jgi:hypothetical protein
MAMANLSLRDYDRPSKFGFREESGFLDSLIVRGFDLFWFMAG